MDKPNPTFVESGFGAAQPGIPSSRAGGDALPSKVTEGLPTSETTDRRLTRLLCLLDLLQSMNRSVRLPGLLEILTQNLARLFRLQVFGIIWTDGSRLQVDLYPRVPVTRTFVDDALSTLLQVYSDAQALSPNVEIYDRDLLTMPTEPAAERVASHLTLPLITSGKAIGAATLCHAQAGVYGEEDSQIFSILTGQLATALENAMLFQRLEGLALVDGITQLCSRNYFDQILDREINRAHRYDRPLSLILLDVDDFKQTNDSYGHQAGDAALRELAAVICGAIRQVDTAARYGGDEFAVLLPQTDSTGAVIAGTRLESQVASHRFVVGPRRMSFTISLGIGSLDGVKKYKEALVREADLALYRAKHDKKTKPTSQ